MFGELLIPLAGMAFGLVHKGKEQSSIIIKKAFVIGLLLGVVMMYFDLGIMSPYVAQLTGQLPGYSVVGLIPAMILGSIEFALGAWFGDILERRFKLAI